MQLKKENKRKKMKAGVQNQLRYIVSSLAQQKLLRLHRTGLMDRIKSLKGLWCYNYSLTSKDPTQRNSGSFCTASPFTSWLAIVTIRESLELQSILQMLESLLKIDCSIKYKYYTNLRPTKYFCSPILFFYETMIQINDI